MNDPLISQFHSPLFLIQAYSWWLFTLSRCLALQLKKGKKTSCETIYFSFYPLYSCILISFQFHMKESNQKILKRTLSKFYSTYMP